MMEHTNTPWYRDGDAIYDNPECTGNPIAHVLTCAYDNDLNHVDARRIVACVNACEGLAAEYLENVGLPEFAGKTLCADMVQQEIDRVTAQRDQLLAALDTLVEAHVAECSDTDRRWALVDARLAIAAVKGGAAC